MLNRSRLYREYFDADSSWSKGEDCYRKCGDEPRICYWKFVMERYNVMGPPCRNCSEGITEDCWSPQCVVADGFNRNILTVNRQIPGPLIQVCKDDEIVVDVVNKMLDYATTIHWHGIRMMGTPHMDGVPMVTQCPIQPFTTFRYRFEASDPGTFFWHSHAGSQKLDGLSGALIVREAKHKDYYGDLYDEDRPDHVIFLQDWTHPSSSYYTPGPHLEGVTQAPDALLINGLGALNVDGINPRIPISSFTVQSGKRYRWRLIGATCMTCAFVLKIEGHRLLVISADGALYFKPTFVDSISINSADRFDFILEANQNEGTYYIMVESLTDACQGIRQVGIIRYSSMENEPPSKPIPPPAPDHGVILNHPNSSCDGRITNEICVSMLQGVRNAPKVTSSNRAYLLFHVAFGFYRYTVAELFAPNTYQHFEEPVYNRLIKSEVNGVSFGFPSSPMLSQFDDIPLSQFCQPECHSMLNETSCTCTNYYEIDHNAIVDIIVYDTGERGGLTHSFHLHGHNFFVIEIGLLPENQEDRLQHVFKLSQRAAADDVNLKQRPMRDSISVPARGYVIIRFVADNPGYWLMHCHFVYHLESGMAAVYKVGRDSDMPPAPEGFPKCGHFYGN